MKRKDWKIKKSKKNIYGNFFKRRRIFFLRKLFLRKNSVFIKKNLVPNFYFYRKLLKFLLWSKNHALNNIFSKYFFKNYDLSIGMPVFYLKKKVFKQEYNFKKITKNFNLRVVYKNQKMHYNNNIIIFNKDKKNKSIWQKFYADENKDVILPKNNDKNNEVVKKDFNFNFNFNFFFLTSLEIYKIIIILYINKLN